MSFVSSPDAENFHVYCAMLMALFLRGKLRIDGFILDINCQFSGNLARNQPAIAAQIKYQLVGWLHANAGHKLACQLKFSGLYRMGLGRCIGEQMEQLWVSCSDLQSLTHRVVRLGPTSIWSQRRCAHATRNACGS